MKIFARNLQGFSSIYSSPWKMVASNKVLYSFTKNNGLKKYEKIMRIKEASTPGRYNDELNINQEQLDEFQKEDHEMKISKKKRLYNQGTHQHTNHENTDTESQENSNKIDANSIKEQHQSHNVTLEEVIDLIRNLSKAPKNSKALVALGDQINHAEQIAVSYLKKLSGPERLKDANIQLLNLLVHTTVSNQRTSKNVIQLTQEILSEYFDLRRERSTEEGIITMRVLMNLMKTVADCDRFSFEFVQVLKKYFEFVLSKQKDSLQNISNQDQKQVFQVSFSDQMNIVTSFQQKGVLISELPSIKLIQSANLSLNDLTNVLWAQVLNQLSRDGSSKYPVADVSLYTTELIGILSDKLRQTPILKNIPRAIQFRLKEINLGIDLKQATQYIRQLDDQQSDLLTQSSIQEDCAIILEVLGFKFKEEARVDPYTVDFLVNNKSQQDNTVMQQNKSISQKLILEMNGPSHYPFYDRQDIMTARDQMKHKNLQRIGYHTLSIHHADWSKIKGVTAKMDFLNQQIVQAFNTKNGL